MDDFQYEKMLEVQTCIADNLERIADTLQEAFRDKDGGRFCVDTEGSYEELGAVEYLGKVLSEGLEDIKCEVTKSIDRIATTMGGLSTEISNLR